MARNWWTATLQLWLVIFLAVLTACDSGPDTSATPEDGNTGSISFNAYWVDNAPRTQAASVGVPDEEKSLRGAVDCGALSIEFVKAVLYDSSNKKIIDKEFRCAMHSGTISGIPAPQDGVTIILKGKDEDGNTTYHGEKGGLAIKKGSDNNAGEIEISSFVPSAAAPGGAANSIEWDAVQGAAEYRVEFSTTEDFNAPIQQQCAENTCIATAEGLSPETMYYTRIYALDSFGNEGARSAVGNMTTVAATLPAGPADVTAKGGDRIVTLNWTAVPGVAYNVYMSTEPGLSTESAQKLTENLNTNTYVHEGLSSDTRYYYIVTAQNFVGESDPSGEVSAIPGWITLLEDGDASSSATDSDGNLYIYGVTSEPFQGQSNIGQQDILLAKLDRHGDLQWARLFGTTDDEYCRRMGVDAAGNIYMTGLTNGDWYAGHENPGALVFLLKVDPSGVQQWVRFLPIEYRDAIVEAGLAVDAEGNSYITSTTPYESGNGRDVVIAKYDTDGGNASAPNWIRYLSSPQDDEGYAIALDGQGALYITGETEGDLGEKTNARVGYSDIFVAKYTAADGTRQWLTLMGTQYYEHGQDVAADQDACYITGAWRGDLFLAKLNGSDGVLLWDNIVEEADQHHAFDRTITVSPSGNVLVGTYIKTAGFDGQVNSGTPDVDSGEYPAEPLLLAYDTNGERLWSELFGTPAVDALSGVTTDAGGYLYLTGITFGDFGGYPNSGSLKIFTWKRYLGQ